MASEPKVGAVKIVGYLEKKGKMKVVTTWKKYWFVLEGRLLLYYRSQEEYENLSPFKGSINMGLVINIRPGLATAGVLEIITRTNTITLRAKHRNIQEKWLQALMDASGQQQQPCQQQRDQSSASSPVKMTHFRYSMDNLIPPPTKAPQLARQNTLPYRFNRSAHTGADLPPQKQIVTRLQHIGAHSYGGSLDSIVKKAKEKKMNDANTPETEAADVEYEKNDLYDLNEVFVENTEYITTADNCKSDCNKNDLLIENDEYLKCDEGLEYYCTYEEINGKAVYAEPDLPDLPDLPRRADDERANRRDVGRTDAMVGDGRDVRQCESDDGSDGKKMSTFSKIARRFRNFKANKKKKLHDVEPFYDTVNYLEINEIKNDGVDDNIVKTLMNLKQTLEENKLKVKDILQSTSSKPEETDEKEEPSPEQTSDEASPEPTDPQTAPHRPGLPPRNNKRPPSPFHDTPKNNSPVHAAPISIDKILDDLALDQNDEELNVRQLIQKFNQIEPEQCADVSLRQKNDYPRMSDDDETSTIVHRYSEDLNKLLEELTKVTCAPLMTPGVTSSLIQMKSPPVTDEEWLALTPIRRRRFSDPDYDVPRPHRSLQILAQTSDENPDEVIPATRFFGPVLSPSNTESWRSMTPDSLEPAQLLQAAMRKHHRIYPNADPDKDDDRKLNSVSFMDSLEPQSEGATAF